MHLDYDNKICNDIMHNDITSINLICMYAVMAHYCGQHIPAVAVSPQQRPCSGDLWLQCCSVLHGASVGCEVTVACSRVQHCSCSRTAQLRFLNSHLDIFLANLRLCLLTPCCLQVGVMTAQRRGGGGWVWLEPAKPPTSDAIGEEVQLTTVHNWSRSRYLLSTLHSTARTPDTGRSKYIL